MRLLLQQLRLEQKRNDSHIGNTLFVSPRLLRTTDRDILSEEVAPNFTHKVGKFGAK